MKNKKLDWNVIRDFNFQEQHVKSGFQQDKISKVSNSVVGIHSARLSTPYVSLISRIKNFKTSFLQEELYKKGNLIKLRCMRRTLHIVSFDLAPIVHNATLSFRISDCHLVYKQKNISQKKVEDIKKIIIDYLKGNPASSENICIRILSQVKIDIIIIRVIIKHLWEEGNICYINTSSDWSSEKRIYALTEEKYPELNLNSIDENTAQRLLVYKHISQYGPVTIKDISWWSGLTTKTVKLCLDFYKNDLIKLSIRNFSSEFYLTNTNYEKLLSHKKLNEDWVALLAYEDPSLKGYFESRERYVSSKNYNKLFNQIGEARASVILNGEVIGIWTWDKKSRLLEIDLFQEITAKQRVLLLYEKEKVENCLNHNLIVQQRLFN